MPIFHRQAYEAVCDGKLPSKLTPAHFADWERLAEALDWLTPEQRCDAAYADWLLQLNSPARQALLQVRNLLIGQGALAANYLAELAQNADDASDKSDAHIRVVPHGDWLFVSNNARKVTSANLLGLCRFFVHSGGKTVDRKIVDLNEQTIGRFGIGFKSSYRIASEVFVHTWDKDGSFTFRLPISRQDDRDSHPDWPRLERLLNRLRNTGLSEFDAELQDVRCLGYCTPEYLTQLPPDLAAKTEHICKTDRGTLFCFHIRQDRRPEVASRITGQVHEVYELCPLFLPYLCVVQLGPNELGVSLGKRDAANDVPNLVRAEKVTLVTQNVEKTDQNASRARFWRLRGSTPQDHWKIALHADSQHRLRVELEEDESEATIKDGAAYAFFPLNAVNWPFRLHLHIDLPTNLARDNWNPDDSSRVEDQLGRAVSGMATWLEQQAARQHPLWRIESLITRKPNAGETWAWIIWQRLLAECCNRKLLRTPWGAHVTADQARTVRLVEKEGARKAWEEFCTGLAGLTDEFPIVNASGALDFGLAEMPDADLRRFFLKALEGSTDDSARRRFVFGLLLVTSAQPLTLEAVAERIKVPYSDGSITTLADLMRRPAGSELPDEWHATFKTLSQWLWEDTEHHGWTSVFDGQLRFHLKKLSQRVINFTWKQIPISLATEIAWSAAGPNFWSLEREPCPAGLKKTVILTLRAKDAGPHWSLLTDLWLVSNSAPHCFHGVLRSWTPLPNSNYTPMLKVVEKLRSWGLWEAWEDAIEEALRKELQTVLFDNLTSEKAPNNPLEALFGAAHQASKDRLLPRWRAVVQEVEERVVRLFVTQHSTDLPGGVLLAPDTPPDLKAVLLLNPEFKPAPSWLTPAAFKLIQIIGAFGTRQVSLLTLRDLDEAKKRQITAAILEAFHKWASHTFTPGQLKAFDELCSATPASHRANLTIGSTSRSADFLKDLINPSTPIPQDLPQETEQANQPLLQHPNRKWVRVKPLPETLRLIPTLAGASLQPGELAVRVSTRSHPLPITLEQVSPDVREDLLFKRMLQTHAGSLMSCRGGLDIEWFRDDDLVAELKDAPFAVKNGHLITCRVEPAADEKQYTEILALYSRKGRNGEPFQRFQQLWQTGERTDSDLYGEFRQQILATLLQTEVHDLGYRPHHIIRELIQNAESAYDSISAPPATAREFKLTSRHVPEGGAWETVAEHSGRHFNQQLRTGQERDDIRLIVSIPSAEQPPTEGWIGRFNRGFKAIFTIAETVQIASGPYSFSVQDMLLLSPPRPQPNPAAATPQTRFTFRCDKTNALQLFMLSRNDGLQPPLPIFDCSSFAFLRNISRVHLQLGAWQWLWQIPPPTPHGTWSELQISQSRPAVKERFLVHNSELTPGTTERNYRFALALRLTNSTTSSLMPAPLESRWHKVRLTFETEDEFPLDFIVNGDFETDSGRLGIRNSSVNEVILVACLRAVKELCTAELAKLNDKSHWLAWAEVLHLSNGESDLSKRFETHHKELVREFGSVADFLCSHVPHNGEVCNAKNLLFPSPLLRRLEAFVLNWGFQVDLWVDSKVEAHFPKAFLEKRTKLTLPDLLEQLPLHSALRRRILQEFDSATFRTAHGALDAVASGELSRARDMLVDKTPPPPVAVVEDWTVAELWNWWVNQRTSLDQYTLDGQCWPLLYPDEGTQQIDRIARIRTDLLNPESDAGRCIWYRLLSLACLMAAGRRISELHSFWKGELERRRFWEKTSQKDFAHGGDTLFSEVVWRPFHDLAASGENAHFWRRVFYDVRKIHQLVWASSYSFPAVLLDLAHSRQGEGLLHFLRSGHLPGQTPWVGVFGQSAGAPIFFLVRELRRLEIITNPEVDSLAFFACTPVRRAAERIGWVAPELAGRADFESLAEISLQLFNKLQTDPAVGPDLLKFYDIPLLHMGLNP